MPLPAGFEWDSFDISNEETAAEIITFLNANYISDPNGLFVEQNTIEKLRWCICTPGWQKDLHFCVRNSKNKKIMATCVLVPKKLIVN